MIVGIDTSKRSTGVVCIDMKGNLVDYLLINADKELDGVELIDYQWEQLDRFLLQYRDRLRGIAFEGLAFNSTGSGKDLLAGIFWSLRFMIYVHYPLIPVGVCPNQSWFTKVGPKEELKALALSKEKDKRKKFAVGKLPFEVRVKFEQYVRELGVKKEAVFDLADSYFIAKYRLSLDD